MNATRFLYVDADTLIHRLHPNTKLLCLVLLFAAVMAFNHPIHEGAAVIAGLCLLSAAHSLTNVTRHGSLLRLLAAVVATGAAVWLLLLLPGQAALPMRLGLLVGAILLFLAARALAALTTGGKFLTLIVVVGSLLWVFFVREMKDPHVVWQIQPSMVERGEAPYELAILVVIAGLLMLAIAVLSLVQVVLRDAQQNRASAGWWVAFVAVVLVGVVLVWRGSGLVPARWLWYLVLTAYWLIASVVVLRRLQTPYALAAWLALVFSGAALYFAVDAFLVHMHMPETRFLWGPTIAVTREGLLYGPAMGLRIVAFLLFGLVFISTTTPEQLTQGLRAMGLSVTPSVALSLAFRLVPYFIETARTVIQAQQSRGLDLDTGGATHRFKKTVPVLFPTLAYALRSADDLTRALETRGLGAGAVRTEYRPLAKTGADGLAVTLCVLVAVACIVLRISVNFGELLPRL